MVAIGYWCTRIMSYYTYRPGIVFTYVYGQLTVWWLCHITAMFWALKFPFQAHKFDVTGKTKYLHLTVVVLGLTLPWIPVIVAFATGGFAIGRFPPVTCFGKNRDGSFYGLVVPLAIADATGLTLLLLIFWIIFKVRLAIENSTILLFLIALSSQKQPPHAPRA